MRALAVASAAFLIALALPAGASAAAGDLDTTFGVGGFRILDEPSDTGEFLSDVLVLPDGRILAGGFKGDSEGALLARFDPNGVLDTGFGAGGFFILPYTGADGETRTVDDLDVQSDGKIVAVGLGLSGGTDAAAILRYSPDGSSLDPAFNGGEPLVLRISNQPTDPEEVAAAPGVKALVVGSTVTPMGSRMFLMRRTGTGTPDVGFNTTGERVIDVPGSSSSNGDAVAALADGSVLAAGSAQQGLLLVKLTNGGLPDAGFGTAGIATHDVGADPDPTGEALDIHVLPDGRILAAGSSISAADNRQLMLARFTPQGELDPSFGSGGVVTRDRTTGSDEAFAMEVQPDGKILVAGYSGPSSTTTDGWLLRFTADGQPDPSFGTGGEVVLSASPAEDEFDGLTIDSFGRSLAVGAAEDGGSSKLLLARFLGDPGEPPPQSVLDPDLRELELAGRRLTPFTVTCFAACGARVELRSRSRLRLPHGSTHRRAAVTIGSATLAGGTGGRRTVRLTASRRARAILKRRRIAARLTVTFDGGQTLTRNVTVRAAQRVLKLNRRGRGKLRVTFQAEADRARRATLTLRVGGRVAARKRFAPTPGRSRAVAVKLNARGRTAKLSLRYRLDTGVQVSQTRRLRVVRGR
jgi:uncharacterized delta-60 repeat protein